MALRFLQWINSQAPFPSTIKKEAFSQALMTKIKMLFSKNIIKHFCELLSHQSLLYTIWLVTCSTHRLYNARLRTPAVCFNTTLQLLANTRARCQFKHLYLPPALVCLRLSLSPPGLP